MLTLTLRAQDDGRFLARIVEQNGNVFVLDFGDRTVIDDATQRIHRGFTVFRGGQLLKAAPRDRDLLVLLADYYAGEGMLVSLEEPLWGMRARSLEEMLADRAEDSVGELSQSALTLLGDLDEETQDLPTDVWGRDEAERVRALIGESRDRAVRQRWAPPKPLHEGLEPIAPPDELEDDPTVEMPARRRYLAEEPTLLGDEDDATEVVARPVIVGEDEDDED